MAFEGGGLRLLLVSQAVFDIFFNKRLVFDEVLFVLYCLLVFALEQDSSGTPLFCRFPVSDILVNFCF